MIATAAFACDLPTMLSVAALYYPNAVETG
jgi:hypothetical protein